MIKGLKSLIAGVAAGTAIAMLFAPKKGSEFRKTLKKEFDKGGIGWDTIKSTFSEMGTDMGSTCKDCYEDLMKNEDFKKASENVKEQATIAKEHAKGWLKDNIGDLKKAKKSAHKVRKDAKKAEKVIKKAIKNAKKS